MAVTPTANAIAKLKLLVAAGEDPPLTDPEVTSILADWAIIDPNDTAPPETGEWDYFDFYGAAEQCWRIKHGRAAKYVNMNADGQQFSLSEIRKACMEQISYYMALRQTGTVSVDGLDTY